MRARPTLDATALFALAFAAAVLLSAPAAAAADESWLSLFDGTTLAGWKASENPASFRVVDGAIACDGPRAHLFYVGADGQAAFENFEAQVEVQGSARAPTPASTSTPPSRRRTGPPQGFEVQVNNSQKPHGDYLELKMTGSLYGIRNVYKALARDDEWFTLHVTVRKPRVEVRVNGTLVVDWVEPPGPLPEGAPKTNRLGRGTFALQCHDPESKVFYREPPGEAPAHPAGRGRHRCPRRTRVTRRCWPSDGRTSPSWTCTPT